MREQKIFEELQAKLNEVPIQNRLGLSAEFSISRKTTAQNIELFYKLATQRLFMLAYYLEWAKILEKNETSAPHQREDYKTSEISISFHDIENLGTQERQAYNTSFSLWTINQIIRELNEFLLFYLLEIHETCLIVRYADKAISPEDIVNGRMATEFFEKMGMKDRLEVLEDFGFTINRQATQRGAGVVDRYLALQARVPGLRVVMWRYENSALHQPRSGARSPLGNGRCSLRAANQTRRRARCGGKAQVALLRRSDRRTPQDREERAYAGVL